jgi:hypothetical protein
VPNLRRIIIPSLVVLLLWTVAANRAAANSITREWSGIFPGTSSPVVHLPAGGPLILNVTFDTATPAAIFYPSERGPFAHQNTPGAGFFTTRGAPDPVAITAVPEPTTFALLTIALVGMASTAWRQRGRV